MAGGKGLAGLLSLFKSMSVKCCEEALNRFGKVIESFVGGVYISSEFGDHIALVGNSRFLGSELSFYYL